MKKKQDRQQIVKAIIEAAELYKAKLVGRKFLYVFDNRYIEVIYKIVNFRHLTGVATDLSAKSFYQLAASRRLQTSQIYFTKDHPYDLCKKKIKHIREIATLAGAESFMLEEIKTVTQTFKFGTTDLKFSLCFNREFDEFGAEKGECYVVESLRDEDCFSRSKEAFMVTHIFSKANDKKQYTECLYMDVACTMKDVPQNVQAMLAEELMRIG